MRGGPPCRNGVRDRGGGITPARSQPRRPGDEYADARALVVRGSHEPFSGLLECDVMCPSCRWVIDRRRRDIGDAAAAFIQGGEAGSKRRLDKTQVLVEVRGVLSGCLTANAQR